MERLSDVELLETYDRAKELKCSPDFIILLFNEIQKRNIEHTTMQSPLNVSV
jgi:hypothetical protein